MNLHFVTALSGERSIHLFLKIILPNLLTPGNLLAFAGAKNVSYKLYSAPENLVDITSSQIFQELGKIIPTSAKAPMSGSPEDFVDRCHEEAINEAREASAALIFLFADTIWADGALKKLFDHCLAGARSVAMAVPDLDEKTFVPAFTMRFTRSEGPVPASGRELARLALAHLHPITKSSIVSDGGHISELTDNLYWRVGAEGLIARCLRRQAVMLRPNALSDTPDNCGERIVTDTDEIAAFRIAQSDKPPRKLLRRKFSPLRLAEHLHTSEDANIGATLGTAIRIHTDDISGSWLAVEKLSDRSVSKALSVARIMDEFPKPMDHVKRVAVFGSGAGGLAATRLAGRCGWEVSHYIDNNPHMWGKHIDGRSVKGPESLNNQDYELIVVSSEPGKEAIFEQLTDMGLKYRDDFIYFHDTVCVNGFEIFIDCLSDSYYE
ncbi:hypothetical protein MNBD_NITROSPINAE02-645 [hydrothermal vent metagenome]|uniref:Uncharacterized protein n=1 Tax=hydrothermal vent metagenome TaxID=652676 RepID=A0A3B1CTY8_9ZZZZ